MKIAYFVHDLNDPAVRRRVRMLHAGNATVTLLGFHRGPQPQSVDGVVPLVLGRTQDARLAARALAVCRAALTARRWRSALDAADVVVARQLETLVLAAVARRVFAPTAPLVFECLDIHRLMTRTGYAGRAMRLIERTLLRQCATLVVSSSDFVRAHFARAYAALPKVELIENKVLAGELPDRSAPLGVRAALRPVAPPWKIGWYGMIRCRRSLDLLAALVRATSGRVEVIIRGRIARNVLPEFDAVVSATPGLSFLGPYQRESDLARIYGDVHFLWAMDFYEAGANSEWLLPNRLYEGGLFGAVPIALRSVAAGAWLARHDVGVLLDEDLGSTLQSFFAGLTTSRYERLRQALNDVPVAAFLYDEADCRRLVAALAGGAAPPPPSSEVVSPGPIGQISLP
jgi:succinoglycan biosynthesis protein ExoL